jgi:ubiquinone/menaquinone biosynthesis C-methylase UbiE
MTLNELVSDEKYNNRKILEINEAGNLTNNLKLFKNYTFGTYPKLDIHAIPYPNDTFDLVIHSDTLEHVPHPIHGLKECLRVLKPGGALCFTIPIVISRLTRNRTGLRGSFHGNSKTDANDFSVQTEYGADFWTQLIDAGFDNVTLHTYEYPSGISILARKST